MNSVDEIIRIKKASDGWYHISDSKGVFAKAKSKVIAETIREACRASNFV